jgi:hypothetical protein
VSGCSDEGGSFAGVDLAELSVTPTVVSFNQIAIGDAELRVVTVENLGGAELIVADYSWTGAANDFSLEDLDGLRVPPLTASSFVIHYRPSDEAPDDAILRLETNGGTADVIVTSLGQAAVLRTNPTQVDLVADEIGDRVTRSVTIFNTGTEAFELLNISIISGSIDFALASMSFEVPVEIGVGVEVELDLAYTPSGRGNDDGVLLLEHDAANAIQGATQVPITGSLRSAFLEIRPAFVEFSGVAMDTTAVQEVELANIGEAVLEITDVYLSVESSDDMSIVSFDGEPWSEGVFSTIEVEPGGTITMEVAYTPSDGIPDNGRVGIVSNDLDFYLQYLEMGGRLAGPHMVVEPRGLGFGTVAGGLEVIRVASIRNAGTEPLEVSSVQVTADSSGDSFEIINLAMLPDVLLPDEEFGVQVAYSPSVEGLIEGNLRVTASNDPLHSPIDVDLGAYGAGEPFCDLVVRPETINYGMVLRGSIRSGRATFRNEGPGNCYIRSVRLQAGSGFPFPGFSSSDAFSLVDPGIPDGTPIGPGGSFVVEAAYNPTSFTVFTEDLGDTSSIEVRVIDPASGDAVECGSTALFGGGFPIPGSAGRDCGVNLQGRSGIADIAAIPAEVDFGLVTMGCNSQDVQINIYNVGSASVTIATLGLESCSDEYTLVLPGGFSTPYTLPVATPLSLEVRYRPEGLWPSTCELVIESDAETAGRLVVPLSGEGTNRSDQTDHFEQISGRKVDLLFVVDNSGSMSDEQRNLGDNFSRLIDAATRWDTDYQIGVITTSADAEYRGRQPGELMGNPRIIIPSTPGLASEFRNHINVGDSGMDNERGMEAAYLALSDPHISDVGECGADCAEPFLCVWNAPHTEDRCGGYNRSFIRDDASLEIVFLSDEPDQSRGTNDFYRDFFYSQHGARNRSLFHANAIVGPRGGCDGAGGRAEEGSGYIEVAIETGGIIGSICDTDFATSLGNIGNRAFGLRIQFFLSRVAIAGSVSVTDDRGRGMIGWTFDEPSNSVVFTEESAPRPGDEFDVSYQARCF